MMPHQMRMNMVSAGSLRRTDLSPGLGLRQVVERGGKPGVRRVGSAAVIEIDGALMSSPRWLYESAECLTHDGVAAIIDQQVADPTVATIVIEFQCPGWGVDGSTRPLEAISRSVAAKRTIARVGDMAASGGYWMAAACEAIIASPTAWCGSIGTLMLSYDDSEAFAKSGVQPVVVASDPDKAMGYPGVPWTETAIAADQRMCDLHSARFFAFVAERRGLTTSAVEGFKAHMFDAVDALALGLIDRVQSDQAFYAWVAGLPPRIPGEQVRSGLPATGGDPASPRTAALPAPNAPSAVPNRAQPLSTLPAAPAAIPTPALPSGRAKEPAMEFSDLTIESLTAGAPELVASIASGARAAAIREASDAAQSPATFAQLKSAFGEDAAFIVDCQAKSLSLAGAQQAYIGRLREANTTLQQQVTSQAAAKPPAGPRGEAPISAAPATPAVNTSGKHPFLIACEAYASEHSCPLGDAMVRMARKDPQQHQDFIAAAQRRKK